MSLDIATLNEEGKPFNIIELDIDTHFTLIQLAVKSFPLIQRISNYYEDAEFDIDELPLLKQELEEILVQVVEEKSKFVIIEMISRVESAQNERKNLHFIAD